MFQVIGLFLIGLVIFTLSCMVYALCQVHPSAAATLQHALPNGYLVALLIVTLILVLIRNREGVLKAALIQFRSRLRDARVF